MKRVIIVSIIGIALIVLTIITLLGNKEKAAAKIYINDVNASVLVETTKPQLHTFDSQFSYLGTFEPNKQAMVSSEGQGKVLTVEFEEGDVVKKGSVLAYTSFFLHLSCEKTVRHSLSFLPPFLLQGGGLRPFIFPTFRRSNRHILSQ